MKPDKETVINETLLNNYEKYYRMAYSYAHNECDAQDIVQESAYKAIFNAERLKEIKYADTWICRIIINESTEFLRKNKKEIIDICKEQGQNSHYENIELREAIERLSPKEKSVILLRYFEDMTLEQVADVAGENLSTVKSRLYRALGKMKLDLSDNDFRTEVL